MKLIPKDKLVDGSYYFGECRNAWIAMWDKDKQVFRHYRYKFGYQADFIEHFEDVRDTHFDGFKPIRIVDEEFLKTIDFSNL